MNFYKNLAEELQDFLDFQKVKDRIMLRLLPYNNELITKGIVHRTFLDMAVTYYYILETEREMIPLKNKYVANWKVKESDLYKAAIENTKKRFPPVLEDVNDYLIKTLEESIESIKSKTDLKNIIRELFDISLKDRDINKIWQQGKISIEKAREIIIDKGAMLIKPMYVLSNHERMYGAACLLYCIKDIANHMRRDLIIIPASVHQLIIMLEGTTDLEEMKRVVKEANRLMPIENRLSNSLYIYERITDTIRII